MIVALHLITTSICEDNELVNVSCHDGDMIFNNPRIYEDKELVKVSCQARGTPSNNPPICEDNELFKVGHVILVALHLITRPYKQWIIQGRSRHIGGTPANNPPI